MKTRFGITFPINLEMSCDWDDNSDFENDDSDFERDDSSSDIVSSQSNSEIWVGCAYFFGLYFLRRDRL